MKVYIHTYVHACIHTSEGAHMPLYTEIHIYMYICMDQCICLLFMYIHEKTRKHKHTCIEGRDCCWTALSASYLGCTDGSSGFMSELHRCLLSFLAEVGHVVLGYLLVADFSSLHKRGHRR